MKKSYTDVLQQLEIQYERIKDKIICTWLENNGEKIYCYTFSDLFNSAASVASFLRQTGRKGKRVLLYFNQGMDFFKGFLGCLFAGDTAVPCFFPEKKIISKRFICMLKDCEGSVILTEKAVLEKARKEPEYKKTTRFVRWVAMETLDTDCEFSGYEKRDNTPAFLQYTSHPQFHPRGAMISMENLAVSTRFFSRILHFHTTSVGVSWLPMYLDLGLVGMFLTPLLHGVPMVYMSPYSFIRKPVLWLEAISVWKGTFACASDSGYELCVTRIKENELHGINLDSWERAVNGAETVKAHTMENFIKRFFPCGFNSNAFCPTYGLSDASLAVSSYLLPDFHTVFNADEHLLRKGIARESKENPVILTGCGSNYDFGEIKIINPDDLKECPDTKIGEIWVKGLSVATGYWNKPDESQGKFNAYIPESGDGPYLRTGDLGFLHNGELFITGRCKDMYIFYGQNYYIRDIEDILSSVIENSPYRKLLTTVLAFSMTINGDEKLIILTEITSIPGDIDLSIVSNFIHRGIISELGIHPDFIGITGPRGLRDPLKAKIARKRIKEYFQNQKISFVHTWERHQKKGKGECAFSYPSSETETVPGIQPGNPGKHLLKNKGEYFDDDPVKHLPIETGERQKKVKDILLHYVHRILPLSFSPSGQTVSLSSLGISSIKAINLVLFIEKKFDIRISMTDILNALSLDELVTVIVERLHYKREVSPRTGGTHCALYEYSSYPLSPGQRALFTIYHMAPESSSYNLGCAVKIEDFISESIFRKAVYDLVQLHPVLRTTFHLSSGKPVQKVHREMDVDVQITGTDSISDGDLEVMIQNEIKQPYILDTGPLIRFRLVKIHKKKTVLILALHHIITDLWSMNLILEDLFLLYQDKAGNREVNNNYISFVHYQNQWLASKAAEKQKQFWEKQLSGPLPVLSLPVDFERPPIQTYRGNSINFSIPSSVLIKLKKLAKSHNVTQFVVLVSAYFILLHKYTHDRDIILGIPVTGRNRPEYETCAGYFLNSVALRSKISKNMELGHYLQHTGNLILDVLKNQEYPFPHIVEEIVKQRDFSRPPLFQTFFMYQEPQAGGFEEITALAMNTGGLTFKIGDINLETIQFHNKISQFDMTLMIGEINDSLYAQIKYNADIFSYQKIVHVAESYKHIVEYICSHPGDRIRDITSVSPLTLSLLIDWWNNTENQLSDRKCLHTLFEEQAAATPYSPAVVSGSHTITFKELNARANRIAYHLIKMGLKPGTPVGLYFDRSIEMIAGMFGALKTGCAYVSIEMTIPDERKKYIIQKSDLSVILSTQKLAQTIPVDNCDWVCIDTINTTTKYQDSRNPDIHTSPEDLAYILYTSGSAGLPKAVAVEHRSIVNYCTSFLEIIKTGPDAVYGLVSSITGDMCYTILFPPLLSGGCLHLISDEIRKDPVALINYLKENPMDCLKFMPSHFNSLFNSRSFRQSFYCKKLIFGAEVLGRELAEDVASLYEDMEIYNHYGPTETTVGVFMHKFERDRDYGIARTIPIGRPLRNMKVYILDQDYDPVPPGVPGELYISGIPLARGYYNDPELTSEKFLYNPYQKPGVTLPGGPGVDSFKRMYKTGDIVRYLSDGLVEFIERQDNQISAVLKENE